MALSAEIMCVSLCGYHHGCDGRQEEEDLPPYRNCVAGSLNLGDRGRSPVVLLRAQACFRAHLAVSEAWWYPIRCNCSSGRDEGEFCRPARRGLTFANTFFQIIQVRRTTMSKPIIDHLRLGLASCLRQGHALETRDAPFFPGPS